jgi:transposase
VEKVLRGESLRAAARDAGVCPRTVGKWVSRYTSEGSEGLTNRSSRPHRLRQPTSATAVEKVEELRYQRWTGRRIAAEVGISPATVSRILKRLNRTGA